MRNNDELRKIASERHVVVLNTLSGPELEALLAALNRQKAELAEEEAFVEFYLKVMDRVLSNRQLITEE